MRFNKMINKISLLVITCVHEISFRVRNENTFVTLSIYNEEILTGYEV